jgi:hypothetical protein
VNEVRHDRSLVLPKQLEPLLSIVGVQGLGRRSSTFAQRLDLPHCVLRGGAVPDRRATVGVKILLPVLALATPTFLLDLDSTSFIRGTVASINRKFPSRGITFVVACYS